MSEYVTIQQHWNGMTDLEHDRVRFLLEADPYANFDFLFDMYGEHRLRSWIMQVGFERRNMKPAAAPKSKRDELLEAMGRYTSTPTKEQFSELLEASDNLLAAPKAAPDSRFTDLLDTMRTIYLAKNSDYADSVADPYKNFRYCEMAGIAAADGALTRLSDKFVRIMNLRKKQRENRAIGVPSESIRDTLIDLANYALITAILLQEEEALLSDDKGTEVPSTKELSFWEKAARINPETLY